MITQSSILKLHINKLGIGETVIDLFFKTTNNWPFSNHAAQHQILDQGSTNIYYKRPDCKYFRFMDQETTLSTISRHLCSKEEKAMAPHSSTLAWKYPMDGGAW